LGFVTISQSVLIKGSDSGKLLGQIFIELAVGRLSTGRAAFRISEKADPDRFARERELSVSDPNERSSMDLGRLEYFCDLSRCRDIGQTRASWGSPNLRPDSPSSTCAFYVNSDQSLVTLCSQTGRNSRSCSAGSNDFLMRARKLSKLGLVLNRAVVGLLFCCVSRPTFQMGQN
jgi:hypothetical protein